MILTPAKRSELIRTLSLLTPDSFLEIVKTSAANIATITSTFGDPIDEAGNLAVNQVYIECEKRAKELADVRSVTCH